MSARETRTQGGGVRRFRPSWMIAVPVVTAAGTALYLDGLQEPIYEARSQMIVTARSSDPTDLDAPDADRARLVRNEIQVLEGEPVRQRVKRNLAVTLTPPKAEGTAVGDTDAVDVTVRSGDAITAQVLADAYVKAYVDVKREEATAARNAASAELRRSISSLQDQINALDQRAPDPAANPASIAERRRSLVERQAVFEQQLDQLQLDAALDVDAAELVLVAELPKDPVEPRPLRSGGLALAAGLVLGLGAALVPTGRSGAASSSRSAPAPMAPPAPPVPARRPLALPPPIIDITPPHGIPVVGAWDDLGFYDEDLPHRPIR